MTFENLTLKVNSRTVFYRRKLVHLTGLEFNLLHLMIQHHEKYIEKSLIAQEVFHCNLIECDKRINSHVSNIRKKLAQFTQNIEIKNKRNSGYQFCFNRAENTVADNA